MAMTEKAQKKLIWILSIAIPVVVALLFNPSVKLDIGPFYFLPPTYATINALTAVALLGALFMVKQKKYKSHENLIKFAMLLSVLFLVGYVLHHITSDTTIYGDTNGDGKLSDVEATGIASTKMIYFIILFSHIALSVAIIPFVLFSYFYGINNKLDQHKKLVKFAFPMWLYVAITGVIVYFMISPFYPA